MFSTSESTQDEYENVFQTRKEFKPAYESLDEDTKTLIQKNVKQISKLFSEIHNLTYPTNNIDQEFLNLQLSATQILRREIRNNKIKVEDAYEYLKHLVPNLTIDDVIHLNNVSVNLNETNNGVAAIIGKLNKLPARDLYRALQGVKRHDNLEVIDFASGAGIFDNPHHEIAAYFFPKNID